jgi:hypothetical protein
VMVGLGTGAATGGSASVSAGIRVVCARAFGYVHPNHFSVLSVRCAGISNGVARELLQEALRTAALAKRTRDASSTRARLSLCAQRFRGVGQSGRSRGVSDT